MEPQKAAQRALLHARARWLGILLALLGLLLFLAALAFALLERGTWGELLIPFAATGLGLAVFGTHNDTTLAILQEYRGRVSLPDALSREMDQEFIFHRLELSELKATPRTAWVMTALAFAAQGWALFTVLRVG